MKKIHKAQKLSYCKLFPIYFERNGLKKYHARSAKNCFGMTNLWMKIFFQDLYCSRQGLIKFFKISFRRELLPYIVCRCAKVNWFHHRLPSLHSFPCFSFSIISGDQSFNFSLRSICHFFFFHTTLDNFFHLTWQLCRFII